MVLYFLRGSNYSELASSWDDLWCWYYEFMPIYDLRSYWRRKGQSPVMDGFLHLKLDLFDLTHSIMILTDLVSESVARLNFDLKPRSRHMFLTLKISWFLEVMLGISFANTSKPGVCTVSCSPRIYIPRANYRSLWGKGFGTQSSQGLNP